MHKKHIKFEIESKTFTSTDLAEILGCSTSTARRRLHNSTTLKELYKPLPDMKDVYVIEGQELTYIDVMERLGCQRSTARARLKSCNTLERLYRPVGDNDSVLQNKHNRKSLDWNDPMFKLTYGKWTTS